ncbi:MAG: DUF1800 domain-containing protein [Candidatus Nanopelagicaceae bacterium]|nr:DUF1800 domain-containing protein [Candidatus Nanopelagicaceae bacterium]
MADLVERRAIARLSHRFGFGPRPGEFKALVDSGFQNAASKLLSTPAIDGFADKQTLPNLRDQGPRPKPNSSEVVTYATEKRAQFTEMLFWWLDRMVLSEHQLRERMTWFWHGHWATSYQKVDDALPMFRQNQTLRKFALGNFAEMSRAMVKDGALIYWLDGQANTVKAPNENLSRELMELFVLGVNRYTESDVRETAKALTGYRVNKTNGDVSFLPKQHYSSSISFLGTTGVFDGDSLSDYLVARTDCALFITERLWYRFISSSESLADSELTNSFSNRDITSLVKAIGTHSAMHDERYAMVKPPLDWFVSVARAFGITPSKFSNTATIRNNLNLLGQVPFLPPNVGGWPADQAWLSTASAQFRISFAERLVKEANLSPIADLPARSRVEAMLDWLGIPSWSSRTSLALRGAQKDPARLALLAICSPEYVVSA